MKKIFKLWLAKELINRGFDVVTYEINIDFPKLKVFLFEDTEDLKEALMDIMKNKK